MRPNKLRQLWAEGGVALNGWLQIPNTWTAELMAHAGWDCLTIDMQHGLHGMESAVQMMQVISSTETVPLARVNWNEPGVIMRLLDAGAYGIICPMINTRAECEAFVGACRYPPQGYRSLGPTRGVIYGGPDYTEHANEEVLTIAMVETVEAMENLEDIASTPGLDMIFVGAGDLRLNLTGQFGYVSDDSQLNAALDRIAEVCAKNNIVAGLFTVSPQYSREMIGRGYRMVTVKTDGMILSEYARQLVDETRQGLT